MSRKGIHTLIIALFASLFSCQYYGQNLDTISKESFGVSGSIGGHVTIYDINGAPNRRDPFYWQLSAKLNIKAAGVAIPFSFTLNQQQRTFTQPFNQFGLSPKYKWITLHLGFRTLRFSDFSLNGNMFLGAGAEITPPKTKLKLKGFYGRFAKSVDNYYVDGLLVGTPTYERWGWGTQATYGPATNNVSLQIFKAADDPNSISGFENDVAVRPSENMVVGIATHQKLSTKLSFDAELDWSAYTKDIRVDKSEVPGYRFMTGLGSLFHTNNTSHFNKAMKANLSYRFGLSTVRFGFRHIDPEYKSMGSIYLNNDFQDITLNYGTHLFDNKVTLALTGGLQRNNLDKELVTRLTRLITGINANYSPTDELNISLNFSNYSATTKMVETIVEDTLRYVQVTKNIAFRTSYTLLKGEHKHNFHIGLGAQDAKINGVTNANFYNATGGWQYGLAKINLTTAVGLTSSKTVTEVSDNSNIGPTVSVNKRFLHNKMVTGLVFSSLLSYSYGERNGVIQNVKLNASYKPSKKHHFYGNIGYAIRNTTIANYNEFLSTIGYNFYF